MYQSIIRDPGGTNCVRLIARTNIVNGSILLVPADTVAFFVCNGQVSEPYLSGRWEINTGVNPFFVRFRNLMTQGDPGIMCQVWYVNTCQENIKTGGTGDLIFEEKRFRISMKARASYALRYVISNPLAFISKLIGMHHNSFCEDDVIPAINAMILPAIKQSVIRSISDHSIHSIQNDLTAIGGEIRNQLVGELGRYGLDLKSVSVTAINIPDSEFMRLAALEEKYANGTVETDIEVDNIKRVYGNVENRTLTEVVTGGLRGKATPLQRETNGMAGMMATLPIQMNIANQMMNQMSGLFPNIVGNATSRNSNSNINNNPPDLPVRIRNCPNCGRDVGSTDQFCRYCGSNL